MTEAGDTLVQAKPLRREDVWVRSAGEEHSLVDPVSGDVHLVNESALAIWQLCDGETSAGEMVEVICDVSGLVPEVVVEDLRSTLSRFAEAGLITWVR